MWDITIAVLLGMLTTVSAYLAVYITLKPPKSAARRKRYVRGFILISVCSVVLIFVQARRANDATNKQAASLKSIEHNTLISRHTYISFSDPLPVSDDPYWPFQEGSRPTVAIQFMSAGGYPATDVLWYAKLVLVRDPTLVEEEERAFSEFRRDAALAAGGTLPAYSQSKEYNTITLDEPLTANHTQRLNDNSLHLCALARVLWSDETGQYCTFYFRCGVKDMGKGLVVYNWRVIGVNHNRELSCKYEVRPR